MNPNNTGELLQELVIGRFSDIFQHRSDRKFFINLSQQLLANKILYHIIQQHQLLTLYNSFMPQLEVSLTNEGKQASEMGLIAYLALKKENLNYLIEKFSN